MRSTPQAVCHFACSSPRENTTANPLFLNTIQLGGPTAGKLAAASEAGFDQIEVWRQDIQEESGGARRSATA